MSGDWQPLDAEPGTPTAGSDVEGSPAPVQTLATSKRRKGSSPSPATPTWGCKNTKCKEAAKAVKELKELRRTFDKRLDQERAWIKDNAGREAWNATAVAQKEAREATGIARRAKIALAKIQDEVGGLSESVATLTTARDTARVSLREKSDLLEQIEGEVEQLQVTIAGYARQERNSHQGASFAR